MLSLLVGASFEILREWFTPPNETDWLSEGAFLTVVVADEQSSLRVGSSVP